MINEEIRRILAARGPLEAEIRDAVEQCVRKWEKENGAKVSAIDIPMFGIGIGPDRWFEFGYARVDILMPDGTEISRNEIRQHFKEE